MSNNFGQQPDQYGLGSDVIDCPHCLKKVKKGATKCPYCSGSISYSTGMDSLKGSPFKEKLIILFVLFWIVFGVIWWIQSKWFGGGSFGSCVFISFFLVIGTLVMPKANKGK
jgi:hypothetical protein